jgi:hypothetical protein
MKGMQNMKRMLTVGIALLCCGCSVVYVPRPIGESPKNIESERSEWAGTWTHANGAMTVAVEDGSNGVLKVGWVESEGGGFKCETMDVYLRESGDWTLASMRPREETNENRFTWARIERKDRMAILWAPDVSKFKDLVREGRLPGTNDGGDVVLGHLGSNELALIRSESNGVVFAWDEPLVLMKISK